MPCSKTCPLSSPWSLSLLTLPFLASIFAAEKIAAEGIELGKFSEEIFRGDRLPLLDFPETLENESL